MMFVVANFGPVEIHMYAPPGMESYSGGIIGAGGASPCTAGASAHNYLVVGYGTDNINGTLVPYWLVRTSQSPALLAFVLQ